MSTIQSSQGARSLVAWLPQAERKDKTARRDEHLYNTMKDVTAGKDRHLFTYSFINSAIMKVAYEETDTWYWIPRLRFYLISTGSLEFEWGRKLYTIIIYDIFKKPGQ